MSKAAINALIGRRLCRLGPQVRSSHRRHRATIANVGGDIHPSPQPPSLIPQPVPIKTYSELPSPSGYPVFGTLPRFLAAGGVQHYHKYVSQLHQELGGVFRNSFAGTNMVFVSDPVAVREVFAAEGQYPRHFIPEAWLLYNEERQARRGIFFMDGEEWKKYRSVLNRRLLRPGPLLPHLPAVSRIADALVDRWTSLFAHRPIPDLERELYHWSLESLGVMILGDRLGLLNDAPRSAEEQQRRAEMMRFIDAIHGIFKETSALGTFPPALAKALRFPSWRRLVSSLDKALASGQALVSAGLLASQEVRARGDDNHTPSLLDHLLHDDKLQEHDILLLLTDLFLAAADTTSHTAVWALYLLGRHPETVQRLRQEVLDATGGTGRVEEEHLAALPYLKGVVKETLRLYPVAPFQTRVLQRNTNLLGYEVPAGMMVALSVYTMGRDPAIFPNPDCFSPDRWLRDGPAPSANAPCPFSPGPAAPRPHSHSFFPFGIGSRSCIGRRLAENELYMLLANLVTRADLRVLNQVDMVIRMVGVTSQPLQVQVKPLTPTTANTRR